MRETLTSPSLARLAGRFVWLELDFDKPENQEFMASHAVMATPTFFVLNPGNEHATATHFGGMSLTDLNQFLDQGELGVKGGTQTPAAAALIRGDDLLGRGQTGEAAAAYREALRLAEPKWPERAHAVRELTTLLMNSGESQACAEASAAEAPTLPREPAFSSIILAGLTCTDRGGDAPWAAATRKTLQPLVGEAIALPSGLRDDRFQIYNELMNYASMHNDAAGVAKWGGRWLDEIEAITPAGEDERSALDIARVDAADVMDNPERVLPALAASEHAMPDNYNASLRFAQMALAAKHYDDAVAACDRGLRGVTGPMGRVWLLRTKATALFGEGKTAAARSVLEEALKVAHTVSSEMMRDGYIQGITQSIAKIDKMDNKPK